MVRKKKTDNVPAKIEKDIPMKYSDSVTFIPVKKIETEIPITAYLNDDKIDINYVIKLLRAIISKVDHYKFNTKDLPLTLNHSLKILLAYLEVKRDQLNMPNKENIYNE